jgi:excinuclease ABC subunit C
MIKSGLDEIEGIGIKTKEILLNHFKSVEKIRSASREELKILVGNSKTAKIINFFNNHS